MRKSESAFKILLVAATLSASAGCLAAHTASPSMPPMQKGIVFYPDNVANPRIPTVQPEPKGAKGNCMEIETAFTYQLAPLISFGRGGAASFSLRDNLRRTAKVPLSLEDGRTTLSVVTAPASEGRKVGLALSIDKKVTASSYASAVPASEWVPFVLRWTATEATLESGGKTVASLKLSAPFNPGRSSVAVYHLDELTLDGEGSFKLDWETGYAGRGEAGIGLDTVVARLHGFDAMVVSQEPPKRDCPMIQICNASSTERKVVLRFTLSSEVRNHTAEWSQEVLAPSCSSVEIPVKFPFTLDTDIYHLSTKTEGSEIAERDAIRNFMFVSRRDEPAGPPKFGFHSYGVSVLGSWPDALPVHWKANYAGWGYIVGPGWIKDWDGNYGLNPDTPPEQWWWEPKIDISVKEGRKTFICATSTPWLPWMREKFFENPVYTGETSWGTKIGGMPNLMRYRQFIHALAERYKGKVDIYEIDNEPDLQACATGKPAAEYAEVMKIAGEEIHATDPHSKVFGISTTGPSVEYIRDALASGAGKYIDGVSWHTYTTPYLPEKGGLPHRLKMAREAIAASGQNLPVMNSETGVYAATRETFDQPMRPERLAELIKQEVRPLFWPTGWPNYALDEWTAAKAMVQNITINFSTGASPFIFFGWDPVVEKGKSYVYEAIDCFNIFARIKDGTMTPSLYTLACAVAMTQMEGVLMEKSTPVNQEGIIGTLFEKADGGQLAVLWSSSGRRTAILRSSCPGIDLVSLFGVEKTLVAKGGPDSFLYRIELDDNQPIYLHMKKPGMVLSPSPVTAFETATGKSGETKIKFTLVNRFDVKWIGSVNFSGADGMKPTPARIEYSLDPGKRTTIETSFIPPPEMSKGVHILEVATKLPDGAPFFFPVAADIRPSFAIPRLSDEFTLKGIKDWKPLDGEMKIDRPEQVAIGRSPDLTSWQEERYWQGPDELSAKVATGYNDKGFFARIKVHDKNKGPLKAWPGVEGSCVEYFFDFRSPSNGRGKSGYEKGVSQIIVKPSLAAGEKVDLWLPDPKSFKGVEIDGGAIDNSSYWVGIFVPWTAVDNAAKIPDSIGFDVGVDGPPAGAVGRKSQIFLFGGFRSSTDASGFGTGILKK